MTLVLIKMASEEEYKIVDWSEFQSAQVEPATRSPSPKQGFLVNGKDGEARAASAMSWTKVGGGPLVVVVVKVVVNHWWWWWW